MLLLHRRDASSVEIKSGTTDGDGEFLPMDEEDRCFENVSQLRQELGELGLKLLFYSSMLRESNPRTPVSVEKRNRVC